MLTSLKTATRSLSARLIVAFVTVILATTIAAGMPATYLIRAQLEQQAWGRVSDGGRATLALLRNEQTRLVNLAILTAERPTLNTLLQQGDTASLPDYLHTLQSSVDLDILAVSDASGRLVATGVPESRWPDPPVAAQPDFRLTPGEPPHLAIIASQPVTDHATGRTIGYVTAVKILNDEFVQEIAAETGFAQSIVVSGVRTATSLTGTIPAVDPALFESATRTGQPQTSEIRLPAAHYYAALMPVQDTQGQAVACVEVALPAGQLAAAENRALLALILSTLVVAAIGSGVGILNAWRLATPLNQLTAAADSISQGDLTTPIPTFEGPTEIATLASALQKSYTSTRHALDDLSQAKEWSDTLISSIVEGIVTFDASGCIDFFSQGAQRITGWSRDEALAQPLDSIFRLSEGGGPFSRRIPPPGGKRQIGVLTRSGRSITLAVTGAQLIPPSGSAIRTALVLRDITEEESILHLRSYFLANISHEFRTPLAALKASVEILLDEVASLTVDETTGLLQNLNRSVTGLQTLIDNLLESASIEAGRFSISRRPAQLGEIVSEAVKTVEPLFARRQQDLAVHNAVDVPNVNVDPPRLVQVLVNLLSNASKYSPVGSDVELSVTRVAAGRLRLSVADQGPGIPPVERANLFHRFTRLPEQDGAQYGIGLGLSVVKAIVQGHGGEVGVDERPGGGSIFWFEIPVTGDEL
jgi:two-component system phosphate regulon sensor histidine kinase PhoR